MSGKIAVFVKDLMFSSRIRASAGGANFEFARSFEDLLKIIESRPCLLILDLSDADAENAVKRAKSKNPEIFCAGFYPHVNREIPVKFKKIGCDQTLPRSRFAREIKGLIEKNLHLTGGA